MKHFLVTGGAGFIGSNVVRHYLDGGHRVTIYDTLARAGAVENLEWLREHPRAENLEVIVGDIRLPPPSLEEAIENSDAVFHMAGQVAVTTSLEDPVSDFEVNALGTFKLLELVRGSRGKKPLFVYASTNKVYGGMEDITIEENERRYAYRDLPRGIPESRQLDFHSPYGCSKGSADQYVRDYARIYGLSTVVFRQSCIYGYRQFGVEDQGWVAWFTIAALLDRPLTVYGEGKQVRDVLFIDDLVAAYDLAVERIDDVSGEVFNIGGGPEHTLSLLELLEYLKEEVNPSLSISFSGGRRGDQLVFVSDIDKAAGVLGWKPDVDWRTGVSRLVDWMRENRALLERIFSERA